MAKASAMYDHERSGGEKKAEKKPEAHEDKKPEEKKPEEKEPEKKAGEGDAVEDKGNGIEKMLEGLKQLHKAHETERSDANGNHREALRQMASRHAKQIRELAQSHMDGMGPGDGAGGEAPAGGAPAAEGGGEEAPAPAGG